jgi:hypothetical protein
MAIEWQEQVRPGVALCALLTEATAALIAMDACRLEELAQCCADLNREVQESGSVACAAAELQGAKAELSLLQRVLFESRANLTVLSRLHVLQLRERAVLSEGESVPRSESGMSWQGSEGRMDYGDN